MEKLTNYKMDILRKKEQQRNNINLNFVKIQLSGATPSVPVES